MTKDYNAKLAEDYTEIKRKVERGMLPLVARNPTIDKVTTEYTLAQAEYFEGKKNPPIAFRDSNALHRYADLVLYEELKWSHPDKMTIVDYPIMSDRNERSYFEKHAVHSDLQYGDRRYTGRRKVHFTDDNGSPQVRNTQIVEPSDPTIEQIGEYADLYDALEYAGLTDRQRQAIDLVFFENMTQEDARHVVGVNKATFNEHITVALRKLREYLSKD